MCPPILKPRFYQVTWLWSSHQDRQRWYDHSHVTQRSHRCDHNNKVMWLWYHTASDAVGEDPSWRSGKREELFGHTPWTKTSLPLPQKQEPIFTKFGIVSEHVWYWDLRSWHGKWICGRQITFGRAQSGGTGGISGKAAFNWDPKFSQFHLLAQQQSHHRVQEIDPKQVNRRENTLTWYPLLPSYMANSPNQA